MVDSRSWRPILFECPRTGSMVQALLHEDTARFDDATYETVLCPACACTHLVNARSGVILGALRTKPR